MKLITLCIALCLPLGAQTNKPVAHKAAPSLNIVCTANGCPRTMPEGHWVSINLENGRYEECTTNTPVTAVSNCQDIDKENGWCGDHRWVEKRGHTWNKDCVVPHPPMTLKEPGVLITGDLLVVTSTGAVEKTVSMSDSTGIRIDRMSDEEWSKLQAARNALADTEAEIVKAHGVDVRGDYTVPVKDWGSCPADSYPMYGDYGGMATFKCEVKHKADAYEIKGQFIIIQNGEAK